MAAPENQSDVGAKDFRMATTVLVGIALLAIILEIVS